jgi:hypothetical protein
VPSPHNTRAKAADAPQDLPLAARLLDQAARHIASAKIDGVDRDSRYAMLYDAARKAADAVMRAKGRRVTQGTGHHIVYLAEAKRLLDAELETVWAKVQAARSIRNDMEYRGREVTELEVAELATASEQLVVAARAYVTRQVLRERKT